MSDKDALVDSIMCGYEFRLQELEAENAELKRKLAEAEAREKELIERIEYWNRKFNDTTHDVVELREALKEYRLLRFDRHVL